MGLFQGPIARRVLLSLISIILLTLGAAAALIFITVQVQAGQASMPTITIAIIIVTLVTLLAIIAIWQSTQRVIIPLKQLQEGVDHLQHGQLDRPVQVREHDEIGNLANAINALAAQLRQRITDEQTTRQALLQLNAELEHRVAERTQALEKSSREMQTYGQQVAEANAQLQAIVQQNERRAKLLEASAHVARAAAMIRNPAELFPQIMQNISQQFGFYHAGVFLLDEKRAWAILQAANSTGGQEMLARGHKLRVGEQGVVGWVAHTGQPRIALDVGADAMHFDNPLLPETRSEMALPLKIGQHVMGVLDVQSIQEAAFSQEDVTVLESLADQLALALESAQLLEQAQTALVEAQSAYTRYIQGEWQNYQASSGLQTQEYASDPSAQVGEALLPEIDQAYRQNQVLALNDTTLVAEKSGAALGAAAVEPARAALVAPIRLRNQVIGVLDLRETQQTRHWNEDEVAIADAVATQVALALENARLFEQTQTRVQQLAVLNEISQVASGLLETEALLQAIYERVQRVMRTDAFFVGIYDPNTNIVTYPLSYDQGQRYEENPGRLYPGSTLHRVIAGGETILMTPATPKLQQLREDHVVDNRMGSSRPSAALVFVPMKIAQRAIGVMSVQSYEPNVYSQEDVGMLSSIASQVTVALENARLFEQARQQVEDLETINRINQIITSAMDQEQLLDLLREQVCAVCGTPNFYLARYIPERQQIDFPLYYERGSYQNATPQPAGSGLTGHILQTNRPLLIHTREELDNLGVVYQGDPTRSYLAVPLRAGERLSAVIAVQDYERDFAFNERHLRILSTIATQAATSLENTRLFEEARHRAMQLGTAAETGKAASALLDPDELFASVVELIRIRFGYYHASIFLLDEDNQYAMLRESTGDVGRQMKERGHKLAVGSQGVVGWAAGSGRSRVAVDTGTDEVHFKNPLLPLTRSELAIPLKRGERVIGVLDVQSTEPDAFSIDDIAILELLGDQVAIAIENSRLFQEAQGRARLLQAAAQVVQAASSILDPEALQNTVVTLLQEQLDLYYASLFLLSEDKRYAVLQAGSGEAGRIMRQNGHRLEVGSASMVGQACLQRRARVSLNIEEEAQHFRNPLLPETRTEVALPLIVGNDILGAVDVQSTQIEAFSEEDIRSLQTLANQVAIALRNATLVTEVRQLYEDQKQTADKLREVDRLKTQFLANMSHELRTPLNSIIGFSRVILKGIDGPLTDMQKQDLTAIHTSGQHLLGLINDILDISKIEAGKMELSFEEVNFQEIIKGVMSTAVGLVKDKPVKLRQEVPEDLPLVWADPVRSRQVLLNLISNAAKFTEQGFITIASRTDARFVRVSVKDTGIGIAPEKLQTIFEAFTQADASTTRKYGGTGLGLAISKRFIEMHGGDLTVESEIGVGTSFNFTLPRARVIEPPPSGAASGTSPTDKKIILAIEDDPSIVTIYRRYLEQHGYGVIGTSDSKQALEMARRLKPHAITLDILMPEKDGWSVIQELKQDPDTRHIPVIIASIIAEQGKGFSLGASDYLVKPIMEEDLVAALKRLNGLTQTQVLAIDDRPEDILLIRRLLEAHPQFVLKEAHSGQEGIEAVQSSLPDVILLDLMMPDMDGFAVLEALKANPATHDIPIIVVTAKTLTEEDLSRLDDNIHTLLSKGQFTEQDLLNDMASVLGRVVKQQK